MCWVRIQGVTRAPGDCHAHWKELIYRMNSSYLWLIVTLSITNHYIFRLGHATDVSLQNHARWVSHWQCELPPITYDSAEIQNVSVYISHLLFLGVSLHKAFSTMSVNSFMLLAMIWCGCGWQAAQGSRVLEYHSSSTIHFRFLM